MWVWCSSVTLLSLVLLPSSSCSSAGSLLLLHLNYRLVHPPAHHSLFNIHPLTPLSEPRPAFHLCISFALKPVSSNCISPTVSRSFFPAALLSPLSYKHRIWHPHLYHSSSFSASLETSYLFKSLSTLCNLHACKYIYGVICNVQELTIVTKIRIKEPVLVSSRLTKGDI